MALKNRELDMGHARALLSLDNPVEQINLFQEIQTFGYSVRKVEEIVKANKKNAMPKKANGNVSNDYDMLKKHLANFFQTEVQLTCNAKGKGKISISFEDEQELERIISMLDKLNV
jgi:ParB family chromosome partitioning protein